MWFENPFKSNDPNSLALLLKNVGAHQVQQVQRSTTVDIWRGNYEDFVEPKPRITIMRRRPDPKTELATVKTLPPDAPAPTARTLLCHHATDTSGHTSCTYPGRCSQHKLSKPAAFEVSKLDQCRTVIDLYEQGVMSGVIKAEQRITRDTTNQRYERKEADAKCPTHACNGKCLTHKPPEITHKLPATSTRPQAHVTKQIVVPKKSSNLQKIQTYGWGEQDEKRGKGTKQVRFAETVVMKCVNPHCGRLSLTGAPCEDKIQLPVKKLPETGGEVACSSPAVSSTECSDKLLPSCYYQHARNRMQRLKDKSKTLVEKVYSPPSSLAISKSVDLVKKYNSAKQSSLRRRRFVVPNVDADCLYQTTKPRRRPKTAPSPAPNYHFNMRDIYPRKLRSRVSSARREKYEEEELGGGRDVVKVGVDEEGPLVFAVHNGKIRRMTVGQGGPCRYEL